MSSQEPARRGCTAALAVSALLVVGLVAGCSSGSGDYYAFNRLVDGPSDASSDEPDDASTGTRGDTDSDDDGGDSGDDDDAQDSQAPVASNDGRVTLTEYSVILGDPDAETHVLVYQDLACPHCRSMHELIADDLEAWAESGDVAVEIVTVDFLAREPDDFSARAANLLATVSLRHPDHFAAVQDAIYEAQDDDPDVAELVELAREAGAEVTDAEAQDVEDQAAADRVEAATDHAGDEDVSSVPQLFVDSAAVTGGTYAEIRESLVNAVESSLEG